MEKTFTETEVLNMLLYALELVKLPKKEMLRQIELIIAGHYSHKLKK